MGPGMLRYKADRRTLVFVFGWYTLLTVAWLTPLGWPSLLWTVLLCQASFFCAVITHNTIHAPIFHNGTLNRAFQVVLTLCYGHPVSMYVPGHNLSHHRFVQTTKDVMRTTKLRYRWNLLNQLLFLPTVSGAILKADFAFAKAMRHQRPRWWRQFLLEAAIFLAFNVALLGLDWQRFLIFVLIPHNFAAWGIVGINYCQHDGCDVDHPYNHSRNFVSPLINWWTFNNGYHGIHHEEPGLHWSRAPEVHHQRLHPHIHPALEQRSFLVYIWKAFIWPGKRLRYDGTPVVLPPEAPDEDWIPRRSDDVPAGDLGAVS